MYTKHTFHIYTHFEMHVASGQYKNKYRAGPVSLPLILGMCELCSYGYAYHMLTVGVIVHLKA